MNETLSLSTDSTSYVLGVQKGGRLACLHYGARIADMEDLSALFERFDVPYGDMVAASRDDQAMGLDDVPAEYSCPGRGDFREPALELTAVDGGTTADLLFRSFTRVAGKPGIPGLPSSYSDDEELETVVAELCDETLGLTVRLCYTAFRHADVIVRRAEIRNDSSAPITLRRAMSAQLDLPASDYDLITFTGTWGNERNLTVRPLAAGIHISDSKLGVSSSRANPFVMLRRRGCTEETGEAFGLNLVYSGSHSEIAEVTQSGRLRFLSGINPAGFSWRLEPGESFCTPEAVMTFSASGLGGVSRNMHRFVRKNIVRGPWRDRERPVLVNNWEGTWFDFDEAKIIAIARQAAKLGAELFVLDDGWFGARNDDTRGLGDWTVNRSKLPRGLDGLHKKIAALGMDFGIWVEPEMVNEDSELYRAHPDWAVKLPGREPALGRNQLVLDLARPEVREYIIAAMSEIFGASGVSYVKWDNNRNFSDMYSLSLPPERQGEFQHRYILGLYEVLGALAAKFPDILFESCASGGNRFDLGMLCYMPQIWTSDNTDAGSRMRIQAGTSYGYPPSVMGAHVSASPCHSTLRPTSVETRFNVAAFGLLGYEMDLTELTQFDKNCIAAQIEYYKAHRRLLQYGDFVRVGSPFDDNRFVWLSVNAGGTEAVAGFYQQQAEPGHTRDILRLPRLDAASRFVVEGRPQFLAVKAFGGLVKHVLPVRIKGDGVAMAMLSSRYMYPETEERYTATGSLIVNAGIRLKQQFGGTGYTPDVRVLGDYGSRLYHIRLDK